MKSYHIRCPKCNNDHSFYRYGKDPDGYQKYLCRTCQHQFAPERPRAREEHTPKSIIFKNMTTLRNIVHGHMNFFTLVSSPNYFCKPSLFWVLSLKVYFLFTKKFFQLFGICSCFLIFFQYFLIKLTHITIIQYVVNLTILNCNVY